MLRHATGWPGPPGKAMARTAVVGLEDRRSRTPDDRKEPTVRNSHRASWRVLLAVLVLVAGSSWLPVSAQPAATFDSFRDRVVPGELVPGAARFGPTAQSPPVAEAFKGGDRVGYAYLHTQFAHAAGYS